MNLKQGGAFKLGIGFKIKEYRSKLGITQKDLAEQLHVTFQAVSRWENDEAEPSFDTLRLMCDIFNCTTDDLFNLKKDEKLAESDEQTDVKTSTPVGVCSRCGKIIYNQNELKQIEEKKRIRVGRHSRFETEIKPICASCLEEQHQKELEEKKKEEARQKVIRHRKTILSTVIPGIVALIMIAVAIVQFLNYKSDVGVSLLITSVFSFTFVGTMILNNTFITDLWLEVASWGFVKFPGVIFSFDLDGLKFLIVMKILFFVLGLVLAIAAVAFATLLAMVLSIFVYPFALTKNIKGKNAD